MTSYKRTAMRDLVVERGVPRGSDVNAGEEVRCQRGVIYHYFPSKEDIMHASMQR